MAIISQVRGLEKGMSRIQPSYFKTRFAFVIKFPVDPDAAGSKAMH